MRRALFPLFKWWRGLSKSTLAWYWVGGSPSPVPLHSLAIQANHLTADNCQRHHFEHTTKVLYCLSTHHNPKETNADGKLSLPPPYKGEPSLQYLQSTPTPIPVNAVNTALKSFHVPRFPWCSHTHTHTHTLITTENPFLH